MEAYHIYRPILCIPIIEDPVCAFPYKVRQIAKCPVGTWTYSALFSSQRHVLQSLHVVWQEDTEAVNDSPSLNLRSKPGHLGWFGLVAL